MKAILLFFTLIVSFNLSAQDKAWEKAKEAVKLMDKGKFDESIAILKECEKLDPENYTYPYEIALANILKKDYKTALKVLARTKKYKVINSQVYQMSGNCYSYLGNPKKAIQEYEQGMKIFPNAGNLHLEKGNIFLQQKNYDEAVQNYKRGIHADPVFPSNYYRLALIYLNSTDKLSGFIYGEIFMNIERTTSRTQEISELLYKTYQKVIQLKGNDAKIDFCSITISADDIKNDKIKFPLCAIFGKNFILATLEQTEVSLSSLSIMRTRFIENYFKEDYKEYPNVLFDYQKKMLEEGLLEAYNFYLLQVGDPEGFKEWKDKNDEQYAKFVEWYIDEKNIINITSDNKFIN